MTSDRIRVLLIEDDPDDVLLLKEALAEAKARTEITHADRLSGGLVMLVEQDHDVVLLDLNLPDSSGLETLAAIVQGFPMVPVVVLSGLGDDFTTLEALRRGAQDYLVKGEIGAPRLERVLRHAIERKQIEDALRMSAAKYRHLVEKVQDIIYAGEVDRDLPAGPLTFVSPQVEAIMGYTPEEFLQDPGIWFESIHPEDITRVGEETAQAFADGRPRRRLYRVRHKLSGAYRWLEDDFVPHVAEGGQVVGYYGLARDVTERMQADEALLQAEGRYRALVESLPNAIVVHQQGRIVYVNPVGVQLLGAQSAAELLGRKALTFMHPDRREADARRMEDIVRSGEAGPLTEETFLRLDGSEVDVEVMSIPFTYQGEAAVITIFWDISERKRAEVALRESEEQLRQSQRMEAVGRLAGGIAHDFNNLLTAIIGHAEVLLLSPCSSDEGREGLGEIRSAADRATTLTRQLLAFSRRQALEPHVFNLNDVAQSMTGLLTRLIGEDVDLVFREDAALWPVEADPGQIEQVIMNLAINARDAMPEGGKLTLKTANVELGENYVVELGENYAAAHIEAEPGPHVMLAVSDTGSGMDPEILSRIFEPFFTTKEQGRGTGLGLSTVYGIVKQSGGNIWVYSEPGQGTIFKIYLPRAEKPIDWSPTARPGPQGSAPRGDATILLVEDEPAVRRLATRILEGHGHQVLGAASPEEAITLFDGHSTRVDLILTDVILPGMSGRAMVEELSLRPGAPPKILYMSGYTQNAIVHEGRLEQGIAFLEKPFTPDGLLRKVREVLDAPLEGQLTTPV
jgi:PAS domain S-box-containing protein